MLRTVLLATPSALAVAVSVWLAVAPCTYRGTTVVSTAGGVTHTTETCASLIEMNGARVLGVLAIPPLLAVAAGAAAYAGRRGVAWVLAIVLLALCIVAGFSVGMLYLPVALSLLAVLAVVSRPRGATTR
jgi:hypothetical protein